MYPFHSMSDVLASDDLIEEEEEEESNHGTLAPGSRLGRYELLVPIAKGGMARVWAARLIGQRGFTKLVAIKTILPHLAAEPEFERMFLDEARIASCVHHPNVCEIYELGEEGKILYLAMEWVSGDSLARLLRPDNTATEAIDIRIACRILADTAAGLHAAHELVDDSGRVLGVVHRDVSPHNVLMSADGNVKVADFGVAKALGQLHEATSAGQLKGKINYMAPEQITGAPIDRRSDVFALGCVLYEATTGHKPFRGDGEHQVMHNILQGSYPRPAQLVPGFPAPLERILSQALSSEPPQRFPTAERFRHALEEFLARSGPLVSQSNVAQLVRMRLGRVVDDRKERVRLAMNERNEPDRQERAWTEPAGMTPSAQAGQIHGNRSGVKQAGYVPVATIPPNSRGAPMASAAVAPFQRPHLPAPAMPPRQASSPHHGYAPQFTNSAFTPSGPAPDGSAPGYGAAPPYGQHGQHTFPPGMMGAMPLGATQSGPAAAKGMSGPLYYVVASVIGLVIASVIGVGYYFLRSPVAAEPTVATAGVPTTAPKASGSVVAASARGVTPAAPSATLAAAAITAPPLPPRDEPPVMELKEVHLKISPESAILLVNGKDAGNVRSFLRPEAGKTTIIVVRAPGFQDEVIRATHDYVPPAQITLRPAVIIVKKKDTLPDNPY